MFLRPRDGRDRNGLEFSTAVHYGTRLEKARVEDRGRDRGRILEIFNRIFSRIFPSKPPLREIDYEPFQREREGGRGRDIGFALCIRSFVERRDVI